MLFALLAACGAGPQRPPRPATTPTDAPVAPIVERVPPESRALADYGPEILLPEAAAVDAEVARVGPYVLRQSQVFARLLAADPKLALSAVDLLVFDVLIAEHARQYDIRVATDRVREVADREIEPLRQRVQAELGGETSFADYVWRIFGMRLSDWERTTELRAAQRLYQGYVIRYLALREDRVQVRYIVHKDRAVLEDARTKVVQGADFATLALRLSEDGLRRDGGLLPPFGRGFPHPVAEPALQLGVGEVSPVFEHGDGGAPRHYLVYCLQRLPGRDLPFAAVQDEIDRDLAAKPLLPIETSAYTLRWRGVMEAKNDDKSALVR